MEKIILIVILFFSLQNEARSLSDYQILNYSILKDLKFTYQPNESAALPCKFTFDPSMNDYKVQCADHIFDVHFYVRPYSHPKSKSLEVLYICQRVKKTLQTQAPKEFATDATIINSHWSSSFWIHSNKESQIESMLVSVGVDNDTASLDARFQLDPQ